MAYEKNTHKKDRDCIAKRFDDGYVFESASKKSPIQANLRTPSRSVDRYCSMKDYYDIQSEDTQYRSNEKLPGQKRSPLKDKTSRQNSEQS